MWVTLTDNNTDELVSPCLTLAWILGLNKFMLVYNQENYLSFFFSKFEAIPHLKETLLYIVRFIVGYVLMLVAMTYNVWLFLAVVAGCGIGYFFIHPNMDYYLARRREGVDVVDSATL